MCFKDWIRTVVIPYVRNEPIDEPKVIIGDNLAAQLGPEVEEMCRQYNVHYVFLPANSTGILQPLDVGVYGPMKRAWRNILEQWKMGPGGQYIVLPRQFFPYLLSELMDKLDLSNLAIKAFAGCGIVPYNPDKIVKKVRKDLPDLDTTREHVSNIVLQELKSLRESSSTTRGRGRGKRVVVEPGVSVTAADLSLPQAHRNLVHLRSRVVEVDHSMNQATRVTLMDDLSSLHNSDLEDDSLLEPIEDVEVTKHEVGELEDNVKVYTGSECSEDMILNKGDYVLVRFKSKTQKAFYYVGKLANLVEPENTHWNIKYLRKMESTVKFRRCFI